MVRELQRITGVEIMKSMHSYLNLFAIPLLKLSSRHVEVSKAINDLNDNQQKGN